MFACFFWKALILILQNPLFSPLTLSFSSLLHLLPLQEQVRKKEITAEMTLYGCMMLWQRIFMIIEIINVFEMYLKHLMLLWSNIIAFYGIIALRTQNSMHTQNILAWVKYKNKMYLTEWISIFYFINYLFLSVKCSGISSTIFVVFIPSAALQLQCIKRKWSGLFCIQYMYWKAINQVSWINMLNLTAFDLSSVSKKNISYIWWQWIH